MPAFGDTYLMHVLQDFDGHIEMLLHLAAIP